MRPLQALTDVLLVISGGTAQGLAVEDKVPTPIETFVVVVDEETSLKCAVSGCAFLTPSELMMLIALSKSRGRQEVLADLDNQGCKKGNT